MRIDFLNINIAGNGDNTHQRLRLAASPQWVFCCLPALFLYVWMY
jgi:hypothetical protein